MDCSPPCSSVLGDSPGKNTGVGCHALFQRIFLTQGSNPCLLHPLYLKADSLQLTPPGNPYNAEYIIWDAGLDESKAGIKIARSINRWYYSNDRMWRETKEPLDEDKKEIEKAGLEFNIQKTKIMASCPITSWQIEGGKSGSSEILFFFRSKISVDSDYRHEIKRCLLLGTKAMTNLDSVLKKQRHFAGKGP